MKTLFTKVEINLMLATLNCEKADWDLQEKIAKKKNGKGDPIASWKSKALGEVIEKLKTVKGTDTR